MRAHERTFELPKAWTSTVHVQPSTATVTVVTAGPALPAPLAERLDRFAT